MKWSVLRGREQADTAVVHLWVDWAPIRCVMEGATILLPWYQECPCTSNSDTRLLVWCHDMLDLLMAEVSPLWVEAEISPEESGPLWCP